MSQRLRQPESDVEQLLREFKSYLGPSGDTYADSSSAGQMHSAPRRRPDVEELLSELENYLDPSSDRRSDDQELLSKIQAYLAVARGTNGATSSPGHPHSLNDDWDLDEFVRILKTSRQILDEKRSKGLEKREDFQACRDHIFQTAWMIGDKEPFKTMASADVSTTFKARFPIETPVDELIQQAQNSIEEVLSAYESKSLSTCMRSEVMKSLYQVTQEIAYKLKEVCEQMLAYENAQGQAEWKAEHPDSSSSGRSDLCDSDEGDSGKSAADVPEGSHDQSGMVVAIDKGEKEDNLPNDTTVARVNPSAV